MLVWYSTFVNSLLCQPQVSLLASAIVTGAIYGWALPNMRRSPLRLRPSRLRHLHALMTPRRREVHVSVLEWPTMYKAITYTCPSDATSFLYQLRHVVNRNNTALWRSPDYVFTRLFVHVFISLFISLSFLNLGNSVRDLQYRVFAMWDFRLTSWKSHVLI